MSHNAARDADREAYPRRLHELEQRFGSLFNQINDSSQKEASIPRQSISCAGGRVVQRVIRRYIGGEVLVEPNSRELNWRWPEADCDDRERSHHGGRFSGCLRRSSSAVQHGESPWPNY